MIQKFFPKRNSDTANPKRKFEIALNVGIVVLVSIILLAVGTKHLFSPKQPEKLTNPSILSSSDPDCLQTEQTRHVLSGNQVVIIDTRDRTAFASRHLKDSINLPALELETRALNEIPENVQVVLIGNFLPQSHSVLTRLGWKEINILCGNDWQKINLPIIEQTTAQ